MKNQLLFAFFLLTTGLGAQTVFVDADNATPGDGSSWADAYANLNDAINTAAAGSVLWVAEGTYVTPDSASFYIDKELTILGGFTGTEAMADEANPTDNLTILSGDVLGNDPTTTFDSLLALDNNRVLLVEDTAQTSKFLVTLDGLTITNGIIAAEFADGDPIDPFAGGGILALGKVNGSRLTFTANRATRGGALFVRTTASNGSTFDDITVIDNYNSIQRAVYIRENNDVLIENSDFQGLGDAKDGSGAFFAFRTDGMIIRNCSFSNINSAGSGGGAGVNRCTNVLIEDCTFDEVLTDGWGGGLNFFNSDATVRGCTFNDNVAVRNGAALYYQTSTEGMFDIRIENCTFNDNAGGAFGGSTAFLAFDQSTFDVTFDGCTINGGTASNNGRGAAGYVQNGNDISLLNSTIEGNVAQGGAFVVNGAAKLDVFKTNFIDNGNTSEAGRGALVGYFVAPAAKVNIDSSLFEGNQVVDISDYFSAGAAVYMFGGAINPAFLDITNTTFSNNATTDGASGGAVFTSRTWDVTIDNVDFLNNTCSDIGGALHSRAFESVRDTSEAGDVTVEFQQFKGLVTNSRFLNNLSQTQGGAIGTFNAAYDVSNSVFVNNTIAGGGASGGAIIFNGLSAFFNDDGTLGQSAALDLTSTLVNNTFFGNTKGNADGAVGNDIALFQRGLTGQDDTRSLSVTIANNAFFQLDGEPSIEIELGMDDNEITAVGNLTLTSLGGNFFNNEIDPDLDPANADDTVNEDLDETSEIEALFVDITDEAGDGVNADLAIPADLADNPLINNGIANATVPDEDIRGNPRGEFPDIGAYEADQSAVSTDLPIADSGLKLTFYPNPTKDALTIQNDDPTITDFTVLVADQQGRTLNARSFSGSSNQLDMTTLPTGVYNLRLVINGKIYGRQVVKQ